MLVYVLYEHIYACFRIFSNTYLSLPDTSLAVCALDPTGDVTSARVTGIIVIVVSGGGTLAQSM